VTGFLKTTDGLGVFIEKNRTSSHSFGQSKCYIFSFRSTKPRFEQVCICGMFMRVWMVAICHGRMIRNSAHTTILPGSLSNLQHSHRVYLDMCTYTGVFIYMYIYVHTHICVCIRMNIWEYIYVYVFRYVYTYYICDYICM